MRVRHPVPLVVVLVALASMTAPVFAVPMAATSGPDQGQVGTEHPLEGMATETTNETTNETAPLGSQISAFMQSTSTATNSSVETGMWVARFEAANTTNKSAMIDRRTVVLQTRLDRLRSQLEAMNDSADSFLTDVRQAGRVASLTTRISALERTLNKTSAVAAEAGVNHAKLARLKTNASSLNGQAVASIARGLSVVEIPGRGPPDDRPGGPPEDKPGGPPEDNGSGPPEDKPDSSDGTSNSDRGNGTSNPGQPVDTNIGTPDGSNADNRSSAGT